MLAFFLGSDLNTPPMDLNWYTRAISKKENNYTKLHLVTAMERSIPRGE